MPTTTRSPLDLTTGGGASTAEDVSYDNSGSTLSATDVQAAIDELDAKPSGGAGSDTTAVHSGDAAGGSLTGTYPNPGVVSASESTAGVTEFATQGEANTGTDDTRVITPLKLAVLIRTRPSAKTTTYPVVDEDSGKTFTNEGASAMVEFDLPAAGSTKGPFKFYVEDADGIQVVADTGDTIRLNDKVSIAAGSVQSTQIGASITLEPINATEWVATAGVGSWDVETT